MNIKPAKISALILISLFLASSLLIVPQIERAKAQGMTEPPHTVLDTVTLTNNTVSPLFDRFIRQIVSDGEYIYVMTNPPDIPTENASIFKLDSVMDLVSAWTLPATYDNLEPAILAISNGYLFMVADQYNSTFDGTQHVIIKIATSSMLTSATWTNYTEFYALCVDSSYLYMEQEDIATSARWFTKIAQSDLSFVAQSVNLDTDFPEFVPTKMAISGANLYAFGTNTTETYAELMKISKSSMTITATHTSDDVIDPFVTSLLILGNTLYEGEVGCYNEFSTSSLNYIDTWLEEDCGLDIGGDDVYVATNGTYLFLMLHPDEYHIGIVATDPSTPSLSDNVVGTFHFEQTDETYSMYTALLATASKLFFSIRTDLGGDLSYLVQLDIGSGSPHVTIFSDTFENGYNWQASESGSGAGVSLSTDDSIPVYVSANHGLNLTAVDTVADDINRTFSAPSIAMVHDVSLSFYLKINGDTGFGNDQSYFWICIYAILRIITRLPK